MVSVKHTHTPNLAVERHVENKAVESRKSPKKAVEKAHRRFILVHKLGRKKLQHATVTFSNLLKKPHREYNVRVDIKLGELSLDRV